MVNPTTTPYGGDCFFPSFLAVSPTPLIRHDTRNTHHED